MLEHSTCEEKRFAYFVVLDALSWGGSVDSPFGEGLMAGFWWQQLSFQDRKSEIRPSTLQQLNLGHQVSV